jgi:myosin heavy subunit
LKLGQSLQSQQEVDRALAELLDALAGRLDGDNEKALQQLKDLAASLDTLEREQGEVADKLDQQAAQPNEEDLQQLEDQQRKLEERTKELAEKLNKNQAGESSQSAKAAAGAMSKASEAAQQKQASDAAKHAREAQQKLQAAKRSVNEQVAQRQADLLREQMARLEHHIHGLLVRQEAVQRETQRLLDLKSKQEDQLSTAQATSLADVATEQAGLANEAQALGGGPQLPSAFALQLEWTASDMLSAANRLREARLDDASLAIQTSAINRLQMILEALQAASSAGNENPGQAPKPDAPPMPPPPADDAPPPDIHDLAEVKLLRAMQAEINRRTSELEALPTTDTSRAEQLAALADEQGKVAELALKLVQSLGRPKRPTTDEANPPADMSDEDLLKKLDEALLPQ